MIDMILPGEEKIRSLAYQLFEARGGEHGWDVADWLTAGSLARFYKNYERITSYLFSDTSATYLGTKNPRVCRFCGRSSPTVSFGKTAHAIPAFLGNRSVFSLYECNECNNAFSEYLEDHFAKMLHGVRTLLRIRGRKSIPDYKTKRKQSRIEVIGNCIEIRHTATDLVASIDEQNDSAAINLETQQFVPLAVSNSTAQD
jgi:hypothetical protein